MTQNKLDTQPVHEDKPTEQELMNQTPESGTGKSAPPKSKAK